MKYGLLKQRNPDPEHDENFLQEVQDLYEGGYSIRRRAKNYLPQTIGEHPARYNERVELTSYISYLGNIVDSFVANLFAQEIAVTPPVDAKDGETPGAEPDVPEFYPEFESNADLKGTTFGNMLREAFTRALVKRRAFIGVDFPRVEGAASSRADEEKSGADRGYLYEVTLEELCDWHYDEVVKMRVRISDEVSVEWEVGRFKWIILRRRIQARPDPSQPRGLVIDEFKVWKRTDDGRVVWEKYRTIPFDPKMPPGEDTELPLFADGVTSFREIPIVEVRIPYGLWVGTKVGPLNKEHYRRRSALLAAQQASLLEIPTLFLAPEIPGVGEAMPAEVAQDPHRGADPRAQFLRSGFIALGDKDRFQFIGPTGTSFTVVDAQLDKLVDEMYRVAHQMASSISNTSSALGRSGTSKQEDRHSTTVILCAYGAIMRDFARRIFTVLSDARDEDVKWQAHGLDHYEMYDRLEVVSEAVQIGAMQIPSRTWRVAYVKQTAMRLLSGLSPQMQETIGQEIDAAITPEEVLDAAFTPASGASAAATPKTGGGEYESELEAPA